MSAVPRWLSCLRVGVEVLAAVSLVAMAVVVGVQAKRIADVQERAARAQRLPTLAVTFRIVADDLNLDRSHDELLILNVGEPARAFTHELLTLVKVTLGPAGRPRTAYIPISGYYCSGEVTAELAVPPLTYGSCDATEPNAVRAERLTRDFVALAERNNLVGSAEIVRSVRVTYQDALGDPRSEYYLARQQGTCRLVDEDGRLLVDYSTHLARTVTPLPFAELTPRDLYEKWSLVVNDERNRRIDALRCAFGTGPRP